MMPAEEACALLDLLAAHGIDAWIDGGWGVDALLGRETRAHDDLDIVVEARHVPAVRELLAARSYHEVLRDDTSAWNFVVGTASGLLVDVHAVYLDGAGDGRFRPDDVDPAYPATALSGTGAIAGRSVRCISPEWVLRFHAQFAFDAQDVADVLAVCAAFGLPLPRVYAAWLLRRQLLADPGADEGAGAQADETRRPHRNGSTDH